MKKLAIITAVAIPMLLASCGTKTIVVEATTTTVEVTVPAASPEDVYFSIVLDNYPYIVNRNGRQWVVEFGNAACDAIDEGMTLEGLLNMLDANTDGELVGFMVRHAILELCPRNQWFLDAAANA